jgi:hypothetical protein
VLVFNWKTTDTVFASPVCAPSAITYVQSFTTCTVQRYGTSTAYHSVESKVIATGTTASFTYTITGVTNPPAATYKMGLTVYNTDLTGTTATVATEIDFVVIAAVSTAGIITSQSSQVPRAALTSFAIKWFFTLTYPSTFSITIEFAPAFM